jgi:hypothetical protein
LADSWRSVVNEGFCIGRHVASRTEAAMWRGASRSTSPSYLTCCGGDTSAGDAGIKLDFSTAQLLAALFQDR